MPSRQQLETALRNAHGAGDTESARRLATALKDVPRETQDFSFGEMVSNIPESAAQFGSDIVAPFLSPVQTAKSVGNLALGAAQKLIPGEQEEEKYADAFGQFLSDRYGSIENFQQTVMKDPVGVLADAASVLTGLGGAVRAGATAGGKIGKVGQAIQKTGAAIDPINVARTAVTAPLRAIPKSVAPKLYKSAAKFSTTIPEAKRAKMVETALEQKIQPTIKGSDKLNKLVDGINSKIDGLIKKATDEGKTIPKAAVMVHLKKVRSQLGGAKIEGGSDLKVINKIAKEFDVHMKNIKKKSLTPAEMQTLKQDVYKRINFERGQGKASLPKEEALKAIGKGAKESIEDVADVRELNAQLGDLLELKDPLNRSASRIENLNLVSLNTPANIGASSVVGGAPAAAASTLGTILGTPKIKTKIAILLHQLNKKGQLEAFLDANLGVAAGGQAAFQAGRLEELEE